MQHGRTQSTNGPEHESGLWQSAQVLKVLDDGKSSPNRESKLGGIDRKSDPPAQHEIDDEARLRRFLDDRSDVPAVPGC